MDDYPTDYEIGVELATACFRKLLVQMFIDVGQTRFARIVDTLRDQQNANAFLGELADDPSHGNLNCVADTVVDSVTREDMPVSLWRDFGPQERTS